MKSMGVNAVRTSHNPPSPELLEYCDRLGLMVMDEAFDMWRMPKVRNGSAKYFDQWGETDIRDMVRRDRTAGPPAQIRLTPDRNSISADGDDLSFVTVRIEDKDGNICPMADNLVKFKVEGAGRIAAVDNGNAASVESFQADNRKAFSGMCLLIVRSQRGQPGKIRIEATSEGLRTAEAQVATSR